MTRQTMTEDFRILHATGISVRFGGLQALDDVNVHLDEGEVLAIVGPNGAGKSTLFNVLSGALRPTQGTVLFRGSDISRHREHRRARTGIARTFQSVQVFDDETLRRNVATAALTVVRNRAAAVVRADELLELVGLGHMAAQFASELGQGQRKRLELARALALDPQLLLLDEVMAGLNPVEVGEIVELIRELRRTAGLHLILIEHLLRAVHSLADRVVVLESGKVLAEGAPAEVFGNARVVEAYLGSKYVQS